MFQACRYVGGASRRSAAQCRVSVTFAQGGAGAPRWPGRRHATQIRRSVGRCSALGFADTLTTTASVATPRLGFESSCGAARMSTTSPVRNQVEDRAVAQMQRTIRSSGRLPTQPAESLVTGHRSDLNPDARGDAISRRHSAEFCL